MIRSLSAPAWALLTCITLSGCNLGQAPTGATVSAPATPPTASPPTSQTSPKEVRSLLATCLPLEQVRKITGLPVTQSGQTSSPQPTCEYTNSEVLRDQSRVVYGIEIGYNKPFGFEPVEGLGNFAERDGGRLTINLGKDGLMIEGRQGQTDLAPERLRQLAEAILK